jgi:hypothetical protein
MYVLICILNIVFMFGVGRVVEVVESLPSK